MLRPFAQHGMICALMFSHFCASTVYRLSVRIIFWVYTNWSLLVCILSSPCCILVFRRVLNNRVCYTYTVEKWNLAIFSPHSIVYSSIKRGWLEKFVNNFCAAQTMQLAFSRFFPKKKKKNKTKQKYSKKKRRRKSLSEKNSIYQLRGIYSTRKFHSCVLESLPSPTSVSLYTPCPQEKKNNLKTDFGSTLSPRRQGMNSGIRIKSSNKKLFTD